MITNPRQYFDRWFELRQDILFNGLTLAAAAKRYQIDKRAISRHLEKYPRIKEAYYSRPWASKQLQLPFSPDICNLTAEAIDDVYSESGPLIYRPGSTAYKKAIAHLTTCEHCQGYELIVKQKSEIPYRFRCPALASMLKTIGANNIAVTEHFLICGFCSVEYDGLQSLTRSKIKEIAEKEYDFYPRGGWAAYSRPEQLEMIHKFLKTLFSKNMVYPQDLLHRFQMKLFSPISGGEFLDFHYLKSG